MKEILSPFSQEAKSIKLGTYRHYKGNLYKVLHIGRHSETLEEMVIYQDCKELEKCWVRPVALFIDNVLWEGSLVPRFSLE